MRSKKKGWHYHLGRIINRPRNAHMKLKQKGSPGQATLWSIHNVNYSSDDLLLLALSSDLVSALLLLSFLPESSLSEW
jgi:hypothetical protein